MYEHYEPTERVFVDREEYLDWMDEALERCKERSVVLHLRGIGGIGKSSLLDYWKGTIDKTIRLDCEQYAEFYDRLNVIAKGSVLLGVNLRRFDVLWQIRQRFVEGVEPVKEKGREWAKEVVMAIPFIGSLASIGSAIGAIGAKVSPKLKGRYGELGAWLQTRLGKDYIQRLLEILWKEPRHAEFLYLDALLEDLNNRKASEKPILFLVDQFEDVDNEKCRWRYRGREITEAELWYVFLASLSNCVGVMASRQAVPSKTSEELNIEESELTELDRESCIELLEQRRIKDAEFQEKIVSVSGGNPFVIKAMCDAVEAGTLSPSDIEDLRADTLEEVRLKTWRRLFRESPDLLDLIDCVGLLPFFNREIMNIVAPDMKTDHWNRLIRLSFVRERGDGTWVLHHLAKELVLAELGDRLTTLTDEVAGVLERASAEVSDFILLGLSITVRALESPDDAIGKLQTEFMKICKIPSLPVPFPFLSGLLELLSVVEIDTERGELEIQTLRGNTLAFLSRYADAEHVVLETLESAQELADKNPDTYLESVATNLHGFARICWETGRSSKAEEAFRESVSICRQLHENRLIRSPQDHYSLLWFWFGLFHFGRFLHQNYELKEAEEVLQEALKVSGEYRESGAAWTQSDLRYQSRSFLALVQIDTGRPLEAERTCREIIGMSDFQELDNIFKRNIYDYLYRSFRFTDRPYEAERVLQNSLDIAKEYFLTERMFWQSFTWGLLNRVGLLRQMGRFSEAEVVLIEALQISREHSTEYTAYRVALILDCLAVLLRETSRYSEAETAHREAVEILTSSRLEYHRYRTWLADALNNQAILLRQLNNPEEAEESYEKALEISRNLINRYPEAILLANRVAIFLNNLGVLYRKTGRLPEAEKTHRESLELRKKLAEKSPEMFLRGVSTSLNNLGVLLAEMGELSEAEDVFKRALDQRRELAHKLPEFYLPRVAMTLNNLGVLLRRADRHDESESTLSEAVEIYEELVSKAPRVYEKDLLKTLSSYSVMLSDLADTDNLSNRVKTRLEELGVEQTLVEEKWLEEEEESITTD